MMNLKTIAGLFFLVLFSQSCMLTSKMDKIVTGYYVGKYATTSINNKHDFYISTDSLKHINGICRSQYNRFLTVPLLVYFYSGEKIKCEINQQLYVSRIVDHLNRLLDTDTTGALKGKRVSLSFLGIPNQLFHGYENHTVIIQFIFGSISTSFSKNEYSFPVGRIAMRYTLETPDHSIAKAGDLEEIVPPYYWKRNGSFSERTFCVENFVGTYDNMMDEHCQNLAQKLVKNLKE